MVAGAAERPPAGAPGAAHLALHVGDDTIWVWEWTAPTSIRPVDWRLVNEVPYDDRTEIDVEGRVVVADGAVWIFVDDLASVRTW